MDEKKTARARAIIAKMEEGAKALTEALGLPPEAMPTVLAVIYRDGKYIPEITDEDIERAKQPKTSESEQNIDNRELESAREELVRVLQSEVRLKNELSHSEDELKVHILTLSECYFSLISDTLVRKAFDSLRSFLERSSLVELEKGSKALRGTSSFQQRIACDNISAICWVVLNLSTFEKRSSEEAKQIIADRVHSFDTSLDTEDDDINKLTSYLLEYITLGALPLNQREVVMRQRHARYEDYDSEVKELEVEPPQNEESETQRTTQAQTSEDTLKNLLFSLCVLFTRSQMGEEAHNAFLMLWTWLQELSLEALAKRLEPPFSFEVSPTLSTTSDGRKVRRTRGSTPLFSKTPGKEESLISAISVIAWFVFNMDMLRKSTEDEVLSKQDVILLEARARGCSYEEGHKLANYLLDQLSALM